MIPALETRASDPVYPEPPVTGLLSVLRERLDLYYVRGRHSFWHVYVETPRQAVLAMRTDPAAFGAVDTSLPKALTERLVQQIQDLVQQLPTDPWQPAFYKDRAITTPPHSRI